MKKVDVDFHLDPLKRLIEVWWGERGSHPRCGDRGKDRGSSKRGDVTVEGNDKVAFQQESPVITVQTATVELVGFHQHRAHRRCLGL